MMTLYMMTVLLHGAYDNQNLLQKLKTLNSVLSEGEPFFCVLPPSYQDDDQDLNSRSDHDDDDNVYATSDHDGCKK